MATPPPERHPGPSPAVPKRWTVLRADWDQLPRRYDRALVSFAFLWMMIALPAFVVIWIFSGAMRPTRLVWALLPTLAVCGPFVVQALRNRRKYRAVLAATWERDGQTCPLCLEDTSRIPCRQHGVGPDQRELTFASWDAIAAGDSPALQRSSKSLARQMKLSLLDRWIAMPSAAILACNARSGPFRSRFGFAVKLGYVIIALLTATVSLGLGRFVIQPEVLSIGITPVFLVLLLLPAARRADRCSGCNQYLATPRPEVCPECGRALTAAGSIKYMLDASPARVLLLIALGLPLSIAPLSLLQSDLVAQAMPTDGAIRFWRIVSAPGSNWYAEMRKRDLTPEQTRGVAEVALLYANQDGAYTHQSQDFVRAALETGALDDSFRADALRTLVDLSLSARRTGETLEFSLDCRWRGVSILADIHLYIEGVSVGDQPCFSPEEAFKAEIPNLHPDHAVAMQTGRNCWKLWSWVGQRELLIRSGVPIAAAGQGDRIRMRVWFVSEGMSRLSRQTLFPGSSAEPGARLTQDQLPAGLELNAGTEAVRSAIPVDLEARIE